MGARTRRLLRFLFEDDASIETAAVYLHLTGRRRDACVALWDTWEKEAA